MESTESTIDEFAENGLSGESEQRGRRDPNPPLGRADRSAALRRRLVGALRRAAPALGLYLLLRAISATSFLLILRSNKIPLSQLLSMWDGQWYRVLAEQGYNGHFPNQAAHGGSYAWFPLYPALMRLLSVLPGLTAVRAGVLISFAASVFTAWALFEIGRWFRTAGTGVVLAGLWALVPAAVIEGIVYADALYFALATWALYALVRRAWLTAGVLCLLAGLTRPSGFVLIAAVCLTALLAVLRREDRRRAVWTLVIAPVGAVAYVLAVGVHFGSLGGYFQMQRQRWNNSLDWGATTKHYVAEVLLGRPDGTPLVFAIATALVFLTPVLIIAQLEQRQPLPWVVYSVGVAFMTLCSDRFYATTARELMPALPFMLLPLASLLDRPQRRYSIATLMLLLAVAAGWYAWFAPIFTGYAP